MCVLVCTMYLCVCVCVGITREGATLEALGNPATLVLARGPESHPGDLCRVQPQASGQRENIYLAILKPLIPLPGPPPARWGPCLASVTDGVSGVSVLPAHLGSDLKVNTTLGACLASLPG